MDETGKLHKRAWDFDAYGFWVRQNGKPEERAKEDAKDPKKMLRRYAAYFDRFEGVRIANICGSCGKKAIPLALLGAEVTVFDISEDNKRYATETAQAANISIRYEVCDILDIDLTKYGTYFDTVFMEGGILHYFHDIDAFMKIMFAILKPGGKMICSDFHPFTKIMDSLNLERPTMSYFSTEIYKGEMAHARFYDEETRKLIPTCRYRRYTVSEIINSIIRNGFTLQRFDEHPAWENDMLPGEFTATAIREIQNEDESERMNMDKRSFILGMITAFSECVAGGCKRLALSPPLSRKDYEETAEAAYEIIEKHGLLHDRELNEDQPEDRRFEWILIAGKQETLDRYHALRKAGYSPADSLKPFSELLSYHEAESVHTGYDAYRELFP